jgi:hypothetical protein
MKSGSVNLTSLSSLSVFKDAGVQGIDVTVWGGRTPSARQVGGDAERADSRAIDGESRGVPLNQATTIREGLFTIAMGQAAHEPALLAAKIPAADDPYGDLVYNMSQQGCTGHLTIQTSSWRKGS